MRVTEAGRDPWLDCKRALTTNVSIVGFWMLNAKRNVAASIDIDLPISIRPDDVDHSELDAVSSRDSRCSSLPHLINVLEITHVD